MYRLTIFHDDTPENPNDEDTLFHLHSFSLRHGDFTDPRGLLACRHEFPEWHEYDGFTCDELPQDHEGEDHEYEGPKGFFLSYFEHGLCRWGLQGTMSDMPDFRWDGVEFAGFLEVKADNEWFDAKSEEEQRELAASFVDHYTDWCNGEAFGYQLEKYGEETCNLGHVHEIDEELLDSCWGFIGSDHVAEEIASVLDYYGVTEDDLEVVDKAYGATDYMRFFPSKVGA